MPLRLHALLAAALLVAAAQPLYAQRTLIGTVQDERGAAVPFAVLELPAQKLGVQADDEGRFSFPLPASLAPTDSLSVSALGYARRRVPVPAGATATLQLAALPVSLNEVVVRGTRAAPVVLGAEEVDEIRSYGQSGLSEEKNTGWQIAYLVDAPPAGYIEEVRFYVRKKERGKCSEGTQAPFRVRLYAPDSLTGVPGADILLISVLTAATKPGWHTVDVRRFNIKAPSQGFFVAMEWVYTDAKYLCVQATNRPSSKGKFITFYGQSLGCAPSNGHTFNYRAGWGWQKSTFGDAAIQAVIQP
ncbi:carboxypeptidase-like regulatory domain-containing protein [Hymenobacter psychrophilus]|uniref:Carboxypeptidase regulatory-like domain-containing protein n=1 Tax=Hymenobacter psychrophilus TaxID=651662 RepID=A0A1H3IJV9_9BACT|nr:carboxypeptidase-like regulatory domain-containing protein [Hymenobacter psychrophilus]SDY27124.1 Carboxypeptidase regulatory-like domain-containing protein [Hymenobacter psychrophilus]